MIGAAARQAVRDAIAEALGDAYDCTRVWAAWSYGTMGADDFALVREDSDRLDEIADAALKAMEAGREQIATLVEHKALLQDALVQLIGSSDPAELQQIELGVRLLPASAEDKAAMLNGIAVLFKVLP